ncbi:MAG: hypothetical protein KF779_18250 [Hyphomonadaceae bacterium]|jgi:hypothetical protein|nr:hypothetical protein [Hyphomonadaceae bacterium]MCC6789839.1 hypothetical protein [Hyphomonadaceae bacterium]
MRQPRTADEACARRDLSANIGSFLAVWGAPVLVGAAASLFSPSVAWAAGAWSLALAWMGAACLVNARRCGRLHCFFSGPVLLAGALLAGLVALDPLDADAMSLGAIVTGALVLFSLTYAIELAWGRYLRRDA